MKFFYLTVYLAFVFVIQINSDGSKNDNVILSRRKRYVAFPEGSSMILALCNTAQVILPFQIFTEGVNWGVSYDLPNGTIFRGVKRHVLRRRQRRDLYNSLETVIDSMGYDGKACLYRALCEAPRRFKSKKISLSERIIHLILKFPQEPISDCEPEDHRLYHWAYRQGRENKQQDCAEMFPACSISLIDFALGYYNDYLEEPDYKTFTPHQ